MKNIYIIPSPISENGIDQIPPLTTEHIRKIKFFVVERARTSRRFIRSLLHDFDLNSATFVEINKVNESHIPELREILLQGHNIGVLSESGVPGIADPGAKVVELATSEFGYHCIPLVGPSSIIMSLSASGLNAQQFTFHGYLPIKEQPLIQYLKKITRECLATNYSQVFIETPYRNDRLIKALLKNVPKSLKLCIARDIGGENQLIMTKSIQSFNKAHFEIGKHPTIFILGQ